MNDDNLENRKERVMEDDKPDKKEEIKKSYAILEKLRLQIAALNALSLDGEESRYVKASLLHIDHIHSCLNNLILKMQESPEIKHKGSRSINR
jgi:hypothetical protein